MKKIWRIFTVGLLFTILSACQGNDIVSKSGIVEDGIYTNEFMGIQFQIPPGWKIASHEEMKTAFVFDDREMFFLSQLDLDEKYRTPFNEGNLFFDILSHSPETGEMFSSVVSGITEKTSDIDQNEIIQTILSSYMFLDASMFNYLDESMSNYTQNYTLKDPVQIGDFEWQLLEVSETFWIDFTIYTTVFFRTCGENLLMLFFNGSLTGDFSEPIRFLNEVGAPRIEHKNLSEDKLSNEYENDILLGKISDIFPDSIVAKTIASSLGHEHTEVEVYQSDLLKIEILSLNSVFNIEGLQYLTNLTALNLWNTVLSDLELLTKLPNLRSLCLEKSMIEDYNSLIYLTQLTGLSLSKTNFRDVSLLTNLINLENLTLDATEVNDISPLKPLNNLEFLSIHGNGISDISVVSNFQKLTNLILTYNQIDDLTPLSELTYLIRLCANWNQINDVAPLKNLTNLTSLNLEMNLISDVSPLANLTELFSLNLSFNALPDITVLSELAVFERIRMY